MDPDPDQHQLEKWDPDPDPHQNVMDPPHCFKVTKSDYTRGLRHRGIGLQLLNNILHLLLVTSVAEPEPVGAGGSRDFLVGQCEGPAPGSGSKLDKTEEILNDILFVHSHID